MDACMLGKLPFAVIVPALFLVGVGMLIRDNGGFQIFNNGHLILEGAVAAGPLKGLEGHWP